MKLLWEQLGDELSRASAACQGDVVLASPFMKAATLERIVNHLPPAVSVTCYTRWRVEEIVAGVSDLECWDVIARRQNGQIRLIPNLHAKYFRFDQSVYVGSANVSLAALGWKAFPNLEAMVRLDVESQSWQSFECALAVDALEVTQEIVSDFTELVRQFSGVKLHEHKSVMQQVPPGADSSRRSAIWVPKLRSPEYLFKSYEGDNGVMSRDGIDAAFSDLEELEVPPGLPEAAFIALVRARLVLMPIIVRIDKYAFSPRRFGEMRTWLARQLNKRDATDDWQCLMRWLMVYFPEKYALNSDKYTEMFEKKGHRSADA